MTRRLKAVLLVGVPSVALIGILGLAAWLWGRRKRQTRVTGSGAAGDSSPVTGAREEDRTPMKKLRATAEEFYPSALACSCPAFAEPSEHCQVPPSDAVAKVDLPLVVSPQSLMSKEADASHEHVNSEKRTGTQIYHSPQEIETVKLLGQSCSNEITEGAHMLCNSPTSSPELNTAPLNLSFSQATSSGFGEPVAKSNETGTLSGLSKKYPVVSSDVQSEAFSEIESFASMDEISPQHLVHTGSDAVPSLPIEEAAKSPFSDLISKMALDKNASNISGSTSAPSVLLSRPSPPQDNLSSCLSSRDAESPLLQLNSLKNRVKVTIQLPRDSVGRFIGKQGRNIKTLMSESNTHVYVNQKSLPKDAVSVPCHIQGSASEVELALKHISVKFPEIDIPSSIDKISPVSVASLGSLSPLFSNIEEDITWNVQLKPDSKPPTSPFYAMVSYIESLKRIWVFPHESSSKLDELHQRMSFFYSYASSMGLPQVKEGDGGMVGRFCAAKVSDIHWLRAHVTKISDDCQCYELQLVDYGSTVVLPPTSIKPLK